MKPTASALGAPVLVVRLDVGLQPDGVVRVGGETGASDQTGGVLVSATVMRDDGTAWISLGPEDVAGIFRIDGCW